MVGTIINDAYQLFESFNINYLILQSGSLPFGIYWLPNLIGGSIATWSYISLIPDITVSMCVLFLTVLKDPVLSLKIVEFIMIIIAQFCSYKLAKYYFRKNWIAWIFSIAYSFSSFYYSQVNDGHISFIMGAALVPLTLLLFEKMLIYQNRKSMLLAGVGAILLFFADVQIMIFTLFYILLRLGYHLIINRKKIKIALFKRLIELIILVSLFAAPFILSFLILQNIGALTVTSGSIPSRWFMQTSDLFLRGTGEFNNDSLICTSYIGIILFGLSLLPMLIYQAKSKNDNRDYLFHWITMLFFLLVAIGTPLSVLVTTFFVRVPDRALSLIIFCFCMCAGYGLLSFGNLFKESKKFRGIIKSKKVKTLLITVLAIAIFADLTMGIQPLTTPVPQLTCSEQFIKNQEGNFRVISYPTIWGVTNYKSSLIDHEMVGEPVMGLRSYPPNNALFSELAYNFEKISAKNYNQTSGCLNSNASKLTALATLCAVKYVTIEKNQSYSSVYIDFFNNSTKYFIKVFDGNDSVVFENRFFQGVVFALKANEHLNLDVPVKINEISKFNLSYIIKDLTIESLSNIVINNLEIGYNNSLNKIHFSIAVSEPAILVVSQAYYPYWIVSNNGVKISQFTPLFNITGLYLDEGTYYLTADFVVAYQANILYISSFASLLLICLMLYADSKRKHRLLNLNSIALFIFGTLLILLIYSIGFGIFNKLLLGLGIFDIVLIIIYYTIKTKTISAILSRVSEKILMLGNRQFTLTLFDPNKADALCEVLYKLMKFFIAIIFIQVLLTNIIPLQDRINWLNDGMLFSMFLILFVHVIRIEYIERKKSKTVINEHLKEKLTDLTKRQNEPLLQGKIKYLHLGLFGGLLGICISGLLLRVITLYTNDFISLGLVLCGSLGGIGFGALTSGNNKLRGGWALLFGILSIIFGLMIIYTTPIIVGHSLSTSGEIMSPIYKWQQYTFTKFLDMEMLRWNSIYYALIGVLIAYLAGSNLSLKTKKRKSGLLN